MTSRSGTIRFPVPQGKRGMLWAWPGQFCCCRHLPYGVMALICRKRPGYFNRNGIFETGKMPAEELYLDVKTFAVFIVDMSVAADKPSFMRIWKQWGYRDVQASHKIQKRSIATYGYTDNYSSGYRQDAGG